MAADGVRAHFSWTSATASKVLEPAEPGRPHLLGWRRAVCGLALSLGAWGGAQAAPVLSVNGSGPCPTQTTQAWVAVGLLPQMAAGDPAATVTDFVRDMLSRLAAVAARLDLQTGCHGWAGETEGADLLFNAELPDMDELLLARWFTRDAGFRLEETQLAAHFAQFGQSGTLGRHAVTVVLNAQGGS